MRVVQFCALILLSSSACKGKIYPPEKIAAEMLPALLDLETTKRAERCDELNKELADFRAGYPYDVVSEDSHCKGISKSKPDQILHGGFMLPSYGNCAELSQKLADDLKRHEGNLQAKIMLTCGADGKPSMNPDVSVQLAARLLLRERLAATVKAANSGTISSEISACYFGVKQEMMKSAVAIRTGRCEALSSAIKIKGMTYDAIWTHARIGHDFEEYQKEHDTAWKEAVKNSKQALFLDQFTMEAQTSACSANEAQDTKALKQAAQTAADTCM